MKKIKIINVILTIFMFFIALNFNNAYAYSPSKSEIVIDAYTGRILYQNNATQKLPMASTTKILTCITAIENANVNDVVTVKKDTCNIEGSSIYLKEGEKYTLKSLLYGLMLRSGNDAAETIADFVGGRNKFISLMNNTAKKCGATNSNFTNPHGLHEENHYTTCQDLAKITAYSLKNDLFSEIVSTKKITVEELSNLTKRVFYNKNKMLNLYEGALGVKTGFTKVAGRCLVSGAEKNNFKTVCVVLNSPQMFERSIELMDKCYNEYTLQTVLSKKDFKCKTNISGAEKSCFGLKILNDIVVPLKKGEECRLEIDIPEKAELPIKKDSIIGKIKIFVENDLLFSENIYTIECVENIKYYDLLKIVLKNFNR